MKGYIASFIVILVLCLIFGSVAYQLGQFSANLNKPSKVNRIEAETKR